MSSGVFRRVWKLSAPASGLNDAPVAAHRSHKRFLVNDADSLRAVDLRLEASVFDLGLFFVYRSSGSAVGVITTHIEDLLGCGEHDSFQRMEKFLAASFGPIKVQKNNFTHIGMDIFQKPDGSAGITRKKCTDSLCPISTSPSFRKDRNRSLTAEELQIRQCKLGELWRLAAVSRSDICACLARFSANFNGLQVIDIYCINDLIKIANHWQSGCALKYHAGPPKPAKRSLSCPDDGWGKPRPIHEGTMMLVGWSDASFGAHLQDGRWCSGYIIGLMSSALTGPAHILQWASKFTRKHVKSSLGAGYAPSVKCGATWR